ncbi:MAG: DMT family transporter [Acidobacteriota bacterium]
MNTTSPVVPSVASPRSLWLVFALITTLFWGVWGALIELPEKAGFPATLGYVVWSLTMIPCAAVALVWSGTKLEHQWKQVGAGMVVGLLGAGGQLILFLALRNGPAYLVFPIISLFPVLTVFLAYFLLAERASRRVWAGVVLSFPAMAMLSYQPPNAPAGATHQWLPLALAVFVMWAVQAYVMKFSTRMMASESLFFYMMAGALVLVPFALWMTDFSQPVEWGWKGPWAAALIQSLNAVGALMLVYALRHGKAMVVVPMTSLAPVLTVILSLTLYAVLPHPVVAIGLVMASLAIWLMAE